MRKTVKIIALLSALFIFGGCADTDSENFISGDPFAQTEAGAAEDYEELFGKYQSGSIKFGNYSIAGNSEIEYNGGEIALSFDMDTSGNKYEVETGFMAYINGVPQTLSLNGGESGELVRVSQKPGQSSRATLSLTPSVTEEFSGEETLQLKIINIFNPSYVPSESFRSFGNAHSGQPFFEADIKVNSPAAASESAPSPSGGEWESVLITDKTAEEYGITKPTEGSATKAALRLNPRGDGAFAPQLLMYGGENYNYRVYVYVNHERVDFNGGGYSETRVKSGYLNVLDLRIEDLSEWDIIYAVAVPTNSDTGSMSVRKSGSVLVLDEKDGGESRPEVTSESEQTEFSGNMNIYSYYPEGYIDEDRRYLLLSRHLFKENDLGCHDLIIYDKTSDSVIGTLDVEGESFPYASYGDGVVTVEVEPHQITDESETEPRYIVYNEKFEPLAQVRNSDISGIYAPKYLPSEKRWYFNKDGGFYTSNGDFSEITKIADFDLCDYYIAGDRIVYYRTVYDYSSPENNADIFGIMELDGNIVNETKAAPYGAGEFRIGRAGDTIYFMSPFRFDTYDLIREPMDGIIFYDCKTKEQRTFYPEDDNENSFCAATPNGKYLVTGILVKENHYTVSDHIIKLYDLESGEPLESAALGTDGAVFTAMCAYDDRVLLAGAGEAAYVFKGTSKNLV